MVSLILEGFLRYLLTICSILCSEFAIKRVNEPFVTPQDNLNEWKI